MKRAEQMAWGAMAGLLVAAGLLFAGAIMYRFTGYWAGALLLTGQALVMGLAGWGMALARQARELNELPPPRTDTGFRMSASDYEATVKPSAEGTNTEAKVIDTGFQRLLVGMTGTVLVGLSGIVGWAIYVVYSWMQDDPSRQLTVTGILGSKPQAMDELCVLIGLTACVLYGVMYWLTRPSRQTGVEGEAASSNFTLGLTGMAALAVATVLGYFRVAWAAEAAAGIIAAFMLLQGMELIVNACRSYSSIEELDQEAVDLQATPLGPMLASVWLGGLRMLAAQSMGLSGEGQKGERSVVARMMPRVLLSLLMLAIGFSCFRVVPPGKVAVLERLGYTPLDEQQRPLASSILHSGLHITYPWPIDQLVYIPTKELQLVDVGQELHASGEWKKVDFQFWMVRPKSSEAKEAEDLFITGDPGSPQFLETYIQVRWRVADPSRFYSAMSHSEHITKSGEEARALPIYEAMVQQATSQAVTQTFAIHTMEHILIKDRAEVEEHCREILQAKLDALCRLPGDKAGDQHRGIEVAYLTIKDLHPPYWKADQQDNTQPAIGGQLVLTDNGFQVVSTPERPAQFARGPASAFELVVSMREFKEQIINEAQQRSIKMQNEAHGDAQSDIANAHTYSSQKVAQASGEADRFVEMTRGMSAADLDLLKRRLVLDTTRELFDPVNKIIVEPKVNDVVIIQNTEKNSGGFKPGP